MSDATAFRIVARKLIVTAAIVGITVVVTKHYLDQKQNATAESTYLPR